MKKRILPIMLPISQYILIFIAFVPAKESIKLNLFFWDLGLGIVIAIINMVYAFLLTKLGENSSKVLFWDMLLKLCNIPIYIVLFINGFIFALFPVGAGLPMVLLLTIYAYLLLLTTSMYGVSGLLQAHRERKITTSTAVVNIILHLFFCVDVISAIVMYSVVKARSKKLT